MSSRPFIVSLVKIELRIASSVASTVALKSWFSISALTASVAIESEVLDAETFPTVENAMEISPLELEQIDPTLPKARGTRAAILCS